jgi:hypothetical protein
MVSFHTCTRGLVIIKNLKETLIVLGILKLQFVLWGVFVIRYPGNGLIKTYIPRCKHMLRNSFLNKMDIHITLNTQERHAVRYQLSRFTAGVRI